MLLLLFLLFMFDGNHGNQVVCCYCLCLMVTMATKLFTAVNWVKLR
jgi:hypothetical protein